MEAQIHYLEQEAYSAVLRAFEALSDAITLEKESLITELRKELRVSDDQHMELPMKVKVDEIIKRIREWRQAAGGHQPTGSSASQPNPGFSKIVLQANLEEKMLCLPSKFVLEYGTQLCNIAKLTVSDGRVWKMEMGRDGQLVVLKNGFKEFAEYYSLSDGFFLDFEYKGNSNFTVCIFDTTFWEISYPVQNVIHVSDSPPLPTTSKIKTEGEKNTYEKQQETRGYRNSSGILCSSHFKFKKPHFKAKIKHYNITHYILYVPRDFSRTHITGPKAKNEYVELKHGDGGMWNMALKRKKDGRVLLGGGWKTFLEDDKLKKGDVCIFELVKKNVFKVHLFIAF